MIALLPLLMAAHLAAQAPTIQPSGAMPLQQPGQLGFRDNPMPQLQGFNIVLLVGESQSSGASIEDVPPAARKALNDMKDFLPYKH